MFLLGVLIKNTWFKFSATSEKYIKGSNLFPSLSLFFHSFLFPFFFSQGFLYHWLSGFFAPTPSLSWMLSLFFSLVLLVMSSLDLWGCCRMYFNSFSYQNPCQIYPTHRFVFLLLFPYIYQVQFVLVFHMSPTSGYSWTSRDSTLEEHEQQLSARNSLVRNKSLQSPCFCR